MDIFLPLFHDNLIKNFILEANPDLRKINSNFVIWPNFEDPPVKSKLF